MTTLEHEQITAAAARVRSIPGAYQQGRIDYVAGILDEWAAAERRGWEEGQALCEDLARFGLEAQNGPGGWGRATAHNRRKAITVTGLLLANLEARGWTAPADDVVDAQIACGFTFSGGEDCSRSDGHVGDHLPAATVDWSARAFAKGGLITTPSTIPADATGLKGRRARIVGPHRWSGSRWAPHGVDKYPVGTVMAIRSDSVDDRGDVVLAGQLKIAASSLALIPDDDDVVDEEVRCGGRFRDAGDCVRDDGHDGYCVPAAPVDWTHRANPPEPPVGTRLRDKRGNVWERRDSVTKFCWASDGITPPYTFELLDEFGPLHQVWESWADVPYRVQVEGRNGAIYRPLLTDDIDMRTAIQNIAAPFIAVLPFGATE